MKTNNSGLPLAILFLGAFALGSSEMLVVGVLELMSSGLSVAVATVGALVTVYAIGQAVGAPVLTALTIRFGRKPVLVWSMAVFLAANLAIVVANDFGAIVAARVLAGTMHGLFVAVALAIGVTIVPPERMGRAISVIIAGFAVSTALGMPLGTLIGQQMGWRAAFLTVVGFGVLVLAATAFLVPAVRNAGTGGLRAQARHAFAPRVLAVLFAGFLVMTGEFTALTYITPFLSDVTGISGPVMSVFLLAFGVANAIGTFAGGWAADRAASTTIVVANVLLIVAMGMLYRFGAVPVMAAIALALWGIVGYGFVPSIQHRVVSLAGPGRDLASSLPASALVSGIAVGALVGSWAISSQGSAAPVLVAIILFVLALPLTWAIRFLRVPEPDPAFAGSLPH